MIRISTGRTIKILKELCFEPTTSFHEGYIYRKIKKFAEENEFPFFADRYGNIIIKYVYPEDKKNLNPVGFVAHMDHPGFEIIERGDKYYKAKWYGRISPKYFNNRVKVKIFTRKKPIHGEIIDFTIKNGEKPNIDTVTIRTMSKIAEPGDFGMIDLSPFRHINDKLSGRAMDDLAGVASLLLTMLLLKENKVETETYFIFTRAEEVGFVGAIHLLNGNLIEKKTTLISVETSSQRPTNQPGYGPIVRSGDRLTVFDPVVTKKMETIAEAISKEYKTFRFQSALMEGGACEATVFKMFGFQTGALALALGNYHNQGPGRKIAPEFINLKDLINLQLLMFEIASKWESIGEFDEFSGEKFERIKNNAESFKDKLLKTKPLDVLPQVENDDDTQEVF